MKKNKSKPFINHIKKWTIKNKFNIAPYKSAIIANGFSFLKKNQIEACRKIISRFLKTIYKKPKFRISINFKTPITKKSLGARMGRGKGSISEYIHKLHKNQFLFEFHDINSSVLKMLVKKIRYKLPVKLQILNFYKNGYCRNKDRLFR